MDVNIQLIIGISDELREIIEGLRPTMATTLVPVVDAHQAPAQPHPAQPMKPRSDRTNPKNIDSTIVPELNGVPLKAGDTLIRKKNGATVKVHSIGYSPGTGWTLQIRARDTGKLTSCRPTSMPNFEWPCDTVAAAV